MMFAFQPIDVTPESVYERVESRYQKQEDFAQYKETDYSNAVRVERGISLEQAYQIADSDPEIDYFFYTKGTKMTLEVGGDPTLLPDPFYLRGCLQNEVLSIFEAF